MSESEAPPPSAVPPPPPREPQQMREPALILFKKKRVRGHDGGHHGGAWKIAYADFVTAMMAFFLLMWLLMSTNHGDLEGIAAYFNRPLQAALQQGPGAAATSAPAAPAVKSEDERDQERAKLVQLKNKIDSLIAQSQNLQQFKNQIKLDVTSEGLRIQVVDDKDRPMFDRGSTDLKGYTADILHRIGQALNGVPNRISIAGHTDSVGYSERADGYTNWELSSERANAARRALVAGGMQESKVLQVRGMADALPLVKNDPANAANRRISILVLNDGTADGILHEDKLPSAPPP